MRKILFVCLGNICRSPMAEMMMKEMVHQRRIDSEFIIDSAGISDEEEGNLIYPLAKEKLVEKGIPVENRRARMITKEDMLYYDEIIVMEKVHKKNLIGRYPECIDKIRTLNETDISDPWYHRNFEITYQEIYQGCKNLF